MMSNERRGGFNANREGRGQRGFVSWGAELRSSLASQCAFIDVVLKIIISLKFPVYRLLGALLEQAHETGRPASRVQTPLPEWLPLLVEICSGMKDFDFLWYSNYVGGWMGWGDGWGGGIRTGLTHNPLSTPLSEQTEN